MQLICPSITVVSTIRITLLWNKVCDKKNKKNENKNKKNKNKNMTNKMNKL